MNGLLAAFGAKLSAFKLLGLFGLALFTHVIVNAFAFAALQFYQVIL